MPRVDKHSEGGKGQKETGKMWKQIPSQIQYEASDLGEIRNKVSRKVLKTWITPRGYYNVSMPSRNYQVHQLVAEAFLDVYPLGKVIHHEDEDKLNNCITNLSYVTQRQNVISSKQRTSKLKENQVLRIRENYISGDHEYVNRMARLYKVHRTTIRDIVTHKTWKL